MRIDPIKLRKIIEANSNTLANASRECGYSANYFSNVLNRGVMPAVTVNALKAVGIDAMPAVIIEQEETKPAKEETSAGWLKAIEDYSYIRSNDSDRITAAIDRLTAVLQEINSKL